MKFSRCSWLLVLVILSVGSVTTLAQGQVRFVQGRRAIKDKISFVMEITRQRNENPASATINGYLQLSLRLADHPATGIVYFDGKPLGRFDESMGYDNNLRDVTYGRHTITVTVASPAIIGGCTIMTNSGVLREILEGEAADISVPLGMEQRMMELERKIHELEAEIATLKKKRSR